MMANDPHQLSQQHLEAWHNYYAYQQYLAQQPPAYPLPYPLSQPQNDRNGNAFAYGTQTQFVTPYQYASVHSPPHPPAPPLPSQSNQIFTKINQDCSYHCDVCELSMESSAALSAHLKSHTVCSDCSFTASPKLVKAHHAAVHGKYRGNGFKTVTIAIPGCKVQRYRICVGNHPEDVQTWIAERRKKFPRQTPAAKLAEENKFSGLLDGYGSSSSEDDEGGGAASAQVASLSSPSKQQVESHPTIPSMDATDNRNHTSIDPITNSSNLPNFRSQLCRYFLRNGNCRNGERCNFSHERSSSDQTRPIEKVADSSLLQHQTERRRERQNTLRKSRKSQTTLLRALLEKDASRERALTLQLLKYIVDCNFFQNEQSAKDNSQL